MKAPLLFLSSLSSLLLAVTLHGCGGSSTSGGTTVDQWQGDATHLAVSGSFGGKAFDVHLEGAAASGVFCNRWYAPLPGTKPDASGNYPDTSQYYLAMKELGGVIDVEGTPTIFMVSYWRHDGPAGTVMPVIPRVLGTSIPAGQTWSNITMYLPGMDVLSGVESAAASGSVSIELNTGTPDSGGVFIPTGGRTGEFQSVRWGPQDHLNISATADCGAAMVATWPQTWVLP